MGPWIGLGVFAAVLVGIGGVYMAVRGKLRKFSREIFGTSDIVQGLKSVDNVHQQTPRSLNGCDSLLLPQILKDFPDFDQSLAKTYTRDYLHKILHDKEGMVIHRIVFCKYLRSLAQKTIVIQAAVSHLEKGERVQKRYELDYCHILPEASQSVAGNCPNCGGAIGFGALNCPYCGARVANVLKNTWKFTDVRET